MSIALVGVSFHTAPVALREQVAAAYAALGAIPRLGSPGARSPHRDAPGARSPRLEHGTPPGYDGHEQGNVGHDASRPSLVHTGVFPGGSSVGAQNRLAITIAGSATAHLPVETLILSTCNRFEVYVADAASEPDHAVACGQAMIGGLAQPEALAPLVYVRTGAAVAEHLFAVAAGLDSQVVGEAQILGQVGDALQTALAHGTAGRQLAALARYAITAGRRVRNETGIGQGSGSISHAALVLARQRMDGLAGRRVLLIGAGKMAEIAAHALAQDAVGAVRVLNRDADRAAAVAGAIGGAACGWESLPEALAWADVVITSTGAPHTLIHAQTVAAILPERAARPLLIIDLAVPRDVDRAVGDLPGVHLADIDVLHESITAGMEQRAEAVPAARQIVAQEVARYMARLATLDAAPTIADLRDHAEQIRARELEKTLRRLGQLSPQEQRAVEAMSVAIVNKLLHAPTVELKRHAADTRFTQTARALFGLEADTE
jgi:glutamyl-tRNA reductase